MKKSKASDAAVKKTHSAAPDAMAAATKKTRNVSVLIPITGSICVTRDVPADASDEEILGVAIDTYSEFVDGAPEWEFTPKVVEGNVCSAMLREYVIEDEEA